MATITDGKDRRIGEGALSALFLIIKDKLMRKEYKTGSTNEFKVLTDNNLTDEMESRYETAHQHSQAAHAPVNAEANVIESVKVNGTGLKVENKAVDVPIPLISNNITTDKTSTAKTASPKAVYDYVSSAISGISSLSFRILTAGEYDANTEIPTITGENGYIYLVPNGNAGNDVYKEWVYINGSFECIGTTEVDLSGYMLKSDLVEFTPDEIQAIWTSVFSS